MEPNTLTPLDTFATPELHSKPYLFLSNNVATHIFFVGSELPFVFM